MLSKGHRYMILHVLLLTKNDLQIKTNRKGRNAYNRQEALAFIQTEWFETLCLSVQMEPSYVRARFINEKGKPTEQRENKNIM
ncbi:MAG: hypothetical protein WD907_07175 [Bacilli bacterium]